MTFDIALHLGTLAAVLIYFFKDWVQVLGQGFGLSVGNDPALIANRKLLWLMVAGTVPAVIAGLLLRDAAETTLRQPYVYGTMLIGFGLVMWIAEKIGTQQKDISRFGWVDAIYVGCAQALAIIPGTSRSGVTISAGLSRGFDRSSAARFSFLLSTPAIAGAALMAARKLHKAGGIEPGMQLPFILGIVISGITGAVVIAFFLRYLRKHSMNGFVWYRIALGILVLALALFRR